MLKRCELLLESLSNENKIFRQILNDKYQLMYRKQYFSKLSFIQNVII